MSFINRVFTYSLLICFLAFGFGALAQEQDYLKVYKDPKQHDTTRILALYELIWEKVYTNLDTAETLAELGLEGELAAKHPKFKSKFYNAFGAINQFKGDYITAVGYYQQGLKLSEQLNDLRGQTVMLGNIGTIYIKISENALALKTLKKCLGVMKKLKDEYSQASIYNNFCIIYLATKDYDLSMQYAMQSKALYEKYDDKNGLVYCYNNIANIYEEKNMLNEALENYKTALKYAEETENVNEIGRTYCEIGNILLTKGELEQAKTCLDKARKIAKENEDVDTQSDVYQNLYQYFKAKNNNAEALKAFEFHQLLKDSLTKEGKQREISHIQFEYEYQKKAEQDSLKMEGERSVNLEKIKAKNAEIAKANIMLIAIVVVVALLIIVSLVIYNRFRLTQKQKLIIEEKNKQTEEQKLIIEEKQKEILDSINYAKRIQDSLLDNFESVKKFFSDSFVLYNPKDIVSGDFYWISKHISNETKYKSGKSTVTEMYYIAVCDSTGHGVPGGFMSLLNMAYLSEAINEKDIIEPNKNTGLEQYQHSTRLVYTDEKYKMGLTYSIPVKPTDKKFLRGVNVETGAQTFTTNIPDEFDWAEAVKANDSILLISSSGLHGLNIRSGVTWSVSDITGEKNKQKLIQSIMNPNAFRVRQNSFLPTIAEDVITQICSNILIEGENVFFAGRNTLYSIALNSGKINWQMDISKNTVSKSALFIQNGKLYMLNLGVASFKENQIIYGAPFLMQVEMSTGAVNFNNPLPMFAYPIDFQIGATDLVLAGKNNLYFINLNDGKFFNEIDVNELRYGNFSEFVSGNDYYVEKEGYFVPLNFINDNVIYFHSSHGKIYGVEGGRIQYEYHESELYKYDTKFNGYKLIEQKFKTYVLNQNFELVAVLDMEDPATITKDKLYFFSGRKLHILTTSNFKKQTQ